MKNSLTNLPNICKEWNQKRNGELKLEDFTTGSHQKVWWKCQVDETHEWQAVIYSRTGQDGHGCPYCSGRYPTGNNNFKIKYPTIAKEWHPYKNKKKLPQNFSPKSNQYAWWKCPKGKDHEWEARFNDRAKGQGCPFCSGNRPSKSNNLKTRFPKISEEWHPTRNTNNPEDYTAISGFKAWWKCKKHDDHEWSATINSRTSGSRVGCPFCSGKKPSKDYNLSKIYPNLRKEWHPTKNGKLTPRDVTPGSNKKVWWQCPRFKTHEWETSTNSRTGKSKTGCPLCSNQTSEPEIRLFTELRYIFKDVFSKHMIDGREGDIFIPKLNLIIEYDGSYFHKGKEKRDLNKNKFFEERGLITIRVRVSPLKKLSPNDVQIFNESLKKFDLNKVVKKISSVVLIKNKERIRQYLKSEHFKSNNEYKKYLSFLPAPFPENSILRTHPALCEGWHYENNYPLEPKNFSRGSHKKVWWRCRNNHEWQAPINNRTSKIHPRGCPYCSGHKVGKDNNLAYLYPTIAKEWHPTNNDQLKPVDFRPGSGNIIWWKCSKGNHHDWKARIIDRTKKNYPSRCPFCSGRKSLVIERKELG